MPKKPEPEQTLYGYLHSPDIAPGGKKKPQGGTGGKPQAWTERDAANQTADHKYCSYLYIASGGNLSTEKMEEPEYYNSLKTIYRRIPLVPWVHTESVV